MEEPKAISLDGQDATGWDSLIGYSLDATAAPFEDRKGAVCAPADPDFNAEELEALAKATASERATGPIRSRPASKCAQPRKPTLRWSKSSACISSA